MPFALTSSPKRILSPECQTTTTLAVHDDVLRGEGEREKCAQGRDSSHGWFVRPQMCRHTITLNITLLSRTFAADEHPGRPQYSFNIHGEPIVETPTTPSMSSGGQD